MEKEVNEVILSEFPKMGLKYFFIKKTIKIAHNFPQRGLKRKYIMDELFDKVSGDIKTAMLARDKVALEALRGMKKEFLEAKTAKGSDGHLPEEVAVKIIQKMIKQRKESAQIYIEQNRPELAENELAEATVIEKYLPAQMTDAELEAAITAIIAQVGAAGPQDMGKVMGVASKQLAGKTEGRLISEKVKALLAK
jgi:hypothetical protein